MKHCIVLGAYGLVGSAICDFLSVKYPDIKVTKLKCEELDSSISEADYIIFAAGYGQPKKFSEDKLKTIGLNTIVLNVVFHWLKPEGKILFVSTAEIYSGAKPPHKETDIGTTTPQHSRACYIEGKRCGEAICMAYREKGYDVKIARLALAYGPGTKAHDTRVINELIEQALTKKKIELMDSGGAHRTYCYVEDAARLMLKILFEGQSDVYNVGGHSETTIYDLALKIAEKTGATVKRGKSKMLGAPQDVRLDMSKTLSEFPMSFINLDEGLDATIEYQKKLYV